MPSWIKEQDGIEWYDETYTIKQSNQKPDQLHKKVAAGKLRCLKDPQGIPRWYARPDVELLREAFLKRSKAVRGRKPSDEQLEARHTREWKSNIDRERKTRLAAAGSAAQIGNGPIAAHQERIMLHEIAVKNGMLPKDEPND